MADVVMRNTKNSMLSFWRNYSDAPTVESMMLNEDAQKFCDQDRWDILSALPDLSGKYVLELGAGIGRFTGYLASHAKHLLATDFIESFIIKNQEQHRRLKNISFRTVEATKLLLSPESIDLVFTNWLLMYLSDEEVIEFLQTALNGLAPGGFIHIRESCTERSTRAATNTAENPTNYRHASQYLEVLNAICAASAFDGKLYGFRILWAKCVPTYIEVKNNWRQVHMLLQKVEVGQEGQQSSTSSKEILIALVRQAAEKQSIVDKTHVMVTNFPKDDNNIAFERYLFKELEPVAASIKGETVLNISSTSECSAGFCSFKMAEHLDCFVTNIQSNFYSFSAMLGQCNTKCDKRIHVNMAFLDKPRLDPSQDLPQNAFSLAVGVHVVSKSTDVGQLLLNLRALLAAGGRVMFLEDVISSEHEDKLKKAFLHTGFSTPVFTRVEQNIMVQAKSVGNFRDC